MSFRANATTPADILAYSEWRPTRWRLATSAGKNYGLFNTHERAARFSVGVQMDLDESDCVFIELERSTGYNIWLGDNIGCSSRRPARILWRDQFGQQQTSSVKNVLSRAADIDAYGITRVVSALRLWAAQGGLHADDLAAWRAVEVDYPILGGLKNE